ncbi:MAG: hypothetical protein A2086_08940 [Spirochaetes bacterium GWD1_27_9]|nr:MAG: hypothetical protein A2Z98_13370 [Spirochaetes bacterium GWB1_27_13]OHD20909.1 MAG: hypothetical protein A2Y34_11790 [Spirochaetes bacterium GWC1_27_15]OHD44705.1 MAG: hypothetical protein A2086_08940 [Spirochaetes bacterium GWD1_27_9]
MLEDNKLKIRILKHSENLFFNNGFSSITMNQIASDLGIGKATIYKYFDSKEAILQEVIESFFKELNESIEKIHLSIDMDYLSKVRKHIFVIGERLIKLQKHQMLDIKKNAPDIWLLMENLREEIFRTKFNILLDEGITNGFLRSDIDKELIILLIYNSIQKISDPDIISKLPYSYVEVFHTIIKIIFEGLLITE